MSKANVMPWSEDEIEATLTDVASLIFHDRLLDTFNSLRTLPGASAPMSAKPDLAVWAREMTKACLRSEPFAKLILSIIANSHPALSLDASVMHLRGFAAGGTVIPAEAYSAAESLNEFLAKNPSSVKWVGVAFFSLSRAIAATAKSSFESDQWSPYSLYAMEMERAFSAADGKVLARLLTQTIKQYGNMEKDFPMALGANAPIAVATMSGLQPDAGFLECLAKTIH
ncbi:hypothetical protein ACYPKM_00855 [Pseudomonas aeruginosa]